LKVAFYIYISVLPGENVQFTIHRPVPFSRVKERGGCPRIKHISTSGLPSSGRDFAYIYVCVNRGRPSFFLKWTYMGYCVSGIVPDFVSHTFFYSKLFYSFVGSW